MEKSEREHGANKRHQKAKIATPLILQICEKNSFAKWFLKS